MTTRRDVLRGSLAAAGLAAFGIPEWAVPALAAGETVVPFTDIPANFATNPSEVVRVLDIRTIENGPTPKDQFFTTQHYGHPTIDPAAFRLKISLAWSTIRRVSRSTRSSRLDATSSFRASSVQATDAAACRASRATDDGPACR